VLCYPALKIPRRQFIRRLFRIQPKVQRNKVCICVLGMHRSGTSCLTGIMQAFGVELGEVYTENLYNKKGNRENSRIVTLNDAVLATSGGAWNNPVVVDTWNREQRRERDAIIEELAGRTPKFWGFKDTRTLFTLPFWLEAIQKPRFIGTFRHPNQVARSLQNRDGAPIEQSWELWRIYNQRLLELARQYGFALVNFDLEPDAYLADTVAKLVNLGLDPALTRNAAAFFDAELRSPPADNADTHELPANVASLYKELLDYYGAN